jgi:hypothetical protein
MTILQDHIGQIVKYCTHLEKELEFAPQTIRNILYDIKSCSYWYLLIFQKTPNVAEIWVPLDNLISNCCLKENRRDRRIPEGKRNKSIAVSCRP